MLLSISCGLYKPMLFGKTNMFVWAEQAIMIYFAINSYINFL